MTIISKILINYYMWGCVKLKLICLNWFRFRNNIIIILLIPKFMFFKIIMMWYSILFLIRLQPQILVFVMIIHIIDAKWLIWLKLIINLVLSFLGGITWLWLWFAISNYILIISYLIKIRYDIFIIIIIFNILLFFLFIILLI